MEAGPMPGGSVPRGRAFDRVTAAKTAVAVGVLVIAAAVLAPTTLTHPVVSPGHSNAPSSTQVATLPTTTPTDAAEAWSGLTLGPYVADAELVADDSDRIGIGTTTSFTLRSLTSTPAVELARGLQVDPPVKLAITAGATADTATVRPVTPLAVGQRYRVRLDSTDGSLAGMWAFRTRAPLHVVGTLPGDHAVDVPTNTGVEITFDQDGVTGVADHLSIAPTVDGRFEEHGRTWAFVATKPLANATIYTVTVHKGIGLTGSTETLESDLTFQFETAATAGPTARIEFGRAMIEIPPDQKPTVLVTDQSADEKESPVAASVGIVIHRLPDFNAVIAAAVALAGPDSWAIAAPSATVSTTGLTKIAEATAPIVQSDAGPLMTIPVRLGRGAYVVTIEQPGAPAQLLIQVTNVSAYAVAGTQTSVVWVNDLGSDGSVAGATVSITGGRLLGTTGADGVVRVPTPTELGVVQDPLSGGDTPAPLPARFLTVTAAGLGSLLVPLGLPIPYGYGNATSWWYGPGSDAWWLLFGTDRTTYRQTDTVHVYGTIRARSDRSVPDGIELRLRAPDSSADAPILRVPVHATTRGVFTADLHIADLPRAQYEVDLFVGKALVSSVWVYVGGIVKPAYQVDAHTDRHSYLAGANVTISTTTAFYDGTPVPGMELQFTAGDQHATAVTDVLGKASVVLKAVTGDGPEGVGTMQVDVAPVHPEEGQIGATLYVPVIPSRSWITGVGTVTGGNIVVTGTLSSFDLAGYEAALAAGAKPRRPLGCADRGRHRPGPGHAPGRAPRADRHHVRLHREAGRAPVRDHAERGRPRDTHADFRGRRHVQALDPGPRCQGHLRDPAHRRRRAGPEGPAHRPGDGNRQPLPMADRLPRGPRRLRHPQPAGPARCSGQAHDAPGRRQHRHGRTLPVRRRRAGLARGHGAGQPDLHAHAPRRWTCPGSPRAGCGSRGTATRSRMSSSTSISRTRRSRSTCSRTARATSPVIRSPSGSRRPARPATRSPPTW